MITSCDAAWFAGLLEGEGCFSMSSTGGGKYSSGVSIRLVMTDQDTVERAARLFGAVAHKQMSPSHMKSGRKPIWRVGVHGRRAAEWMMTVYCLLGARRQAKVRELLAWWKTSRGAYSLRTTCPTVIYTVWITHMSTKAAELAENANADGIEGKPKRSAGFGQKRRQRHYANCKRVAASLV